MTAVGGRPRRIAIAGVFDLPNYGDLMFPLIARDRLAPAGLEIVPVAPTGCSPGIADAIDPVSLSDVLEGRERFDGMIVGGGYIIHALPMDFMGEYAAAGVGGWSAAGLWIGMALAGALADIPVAWNAPGVFQRFTGRQRMLVEPVLRAADYLAVRDQGSADLLGAPADVPVAVVPDPVAGIADLWPRAGLEGAFQALLARKGRLADSRYFAVHLRTRSVAGVPMAEIAGAVDAFARRHGMTPLLIAVGRNHDDPATMRMLAAAMSVPHLLLDDPLGLREITAALAWSSLYVGASLHGYVAAAAFGVPGVLVARPAYKKFGGFLHHNGRIGDLARDWTEAFAKADTRVAAGGAALPSAVPEALDAHWERIRQALSTPDRRRAERGALVRSALRAALADGASAAVLRPYLSHAGATWPAHISV